MLKGSLRSQPMARKRDITAEAVNADGVNWNVTVSKRPTGTSPYAPSGEQTGRYGSPTSDSSIDDGLMTKPFVMFRIAGNSTHVALYRY